ncbi:MAG: acyl-CoA dehydrogenase [Nitrosomonadales bacterium]|nr:acyl-CoA dehydrogenase [Nitrosomonadales bacterium]
MLVVMFIAVFAVCLALAIFRASLLSWLLAAVVLEFFVASESRISAETLQVFHILLAVLVALVGISPLRRALISRPILHAFRLRLPPTSVTEQEALDAGTIWWERGLFKGHPEWDQLLHSPQSTLIDAEQSFLDQETEQLCAMIDDWGDTHIRHDLSPEVWRFIREHRFFGLSIPKEYGGLGFSVQAHSAVIAKLASRSTSVAVTVMVPNALGPAELLLHYGTPQQREKYLPRLAQGLEIPCFALTGPWAGSDAASISDAGVVCRGCFGGEENVLGIRLNWEKRYITLAPVATLLGLVFKLHDPEHLLGEDEYLGITLALIPRDTLGVEIGRRHNPLDAAFMNGPTSGRDVFIPLDHVIGGVERVGQGWRMLMECLAAGRAISLPASAAGGMKLLARTSSAYARVRQQFKQPIGRFEGVEALLARIAGHTYLVDAARRLTASALDMGEKPSVISAIIKYHATELGRVVVNDAMDIHGGKGICLGPNNYLGRLHQQIPIGITVEGANILTRSLMIFGQGVLRSHPYLHQEIAATRETDPQQALRDFDAALFGHCSFAMSNAARTLLFGLTAGRGLPTPPGRETRRYFQQLTRFAAAFALMTDVVLALFGGQLRRHEGISARLADVLSQLYLAAAVLKRFEDDGRPAEDQPVLDWAMQDALFHIQQALDGVLHNLPRPLGWAARSLVFPLGRRFALPPDALVHQVAELMMQPGPARDRLTAGIYLASDEGDAVGALEQALLSTLRCEPLQHRLDAAFHADKLGAANEIERIREAQRIGLIDADEASQLERDHALRRKVIMVDDF